MSSLHPARRSAERFDSLLQGEQGASEPRDAQLLQLVGALQTLPRAEARPEFVSDLRERLMLAAATELVVPDSPAGLERSTADRLTVRTKRTPRERRLAVALGGFAIVGATTSMAVAAQSALPGDVLYPLKRAMENAEAGFSVSDEAKGTTILANASGRLDEVDALTRDGDADATDVAETLQTFSDQATEASELLIADYQTTGSESSINQLRDFASASIDTLADLEESIPTGAEQALEDAARVLFQIDTEAGNQCPLCESPGITSVPTELLSAGGPALDDAAVDLAAQDTAVTKGRSKKPGKAKPTVDATPTIVAGEDPTSTSGPIETLPTHSASEAPSNNNSNTGQGHEAPPSVAITTSVPSIGIPAVDDIVDDVVKGVGDGVGTLGK